MTYTYDMICNMDDADVIDVIRLDDEQSESVLDMFVKKHKDLVRKRARKLYLVGGETEDLIQEGMIDFTRQFSNIREIKMYHSQHLPIQ